MAATLVSLPLREDGAAPSLPPGTPLRTATLPRGSLPAPWISELDPALSGERR